MEWLNYRHLLYFWVVVREGGLVQGGKVLRLSHPTLSAQIHLLEEQLGEKVLVKVGRKLVLTEVGKIVHRYADEIFGLGQELLETVRGRPTGQPMRLRVGIADVVPKLLVLRLLRPALALAESIKLVCQEDSLPNLLEGLASHSLDLVLSESPVPPGSSVRAFTHQLGESGVTFFGSKALVKQYKSGFPASLDGAPVLLPLENLSLRRSLDHWFNRNGLKPRVVAEFEDSALLKTFGGEGLGLFPAPSVIEKEVAAQHEVQVLGRLEGVTESFYAISAERRVSHPAVVALMGTARQELFTDR